MNLERDLEVYQREARNHEKLGRGYRDLIKKIQDSIKERDEKAEAEALIETPE